MKIKSTDDRKLLGWHFVGDTLRDGRPVPKDGEVLRHKGDLVLCNSGLHASERLIDALRYAPGATICRVESSGEIFTDKDKFVAEKRRILWRVDGRWLLPEFARGCARDVLHLWEPPSVVKKFLYRESSSVGLDAAESAAAYAAKYAAVYAAYAAEYATKSAAYAAYAAADAAEYATKSAVYAAYAAADAADAADAAEYAAKSAAAYAAAESAAESAAARGGGESVVNRYNTILTNMVELAHTTQRKD